MDLTELLQKYQLLLEENNRLKEEIKSLQSRFGAKTLKQKTEKQQEKNIVNTKITGSLDGIEDEKRKRGRK